MQPSATLAATVLASCGELSAADLGGALGWRVKRSRETLELLVDRGEATRADVEGLTLYRRHYGGMRTRAQGGIESGDLALRAWPNPQQRRATWKR